MLTTIRFIIGWFVEMKTRGAKPLVFESLLPWLLLDVLMQATAFVLAIVMLLNAIG